MSSASCARPHLLLGRKRKAESELSNQPRTVKWRNKWRGLTSDGRNIKRAKERDRLAISYAMGKLEADPEYQRASEARRERMRAAAKASTMRKRLVSCVLDFFILTSVLISYSVEQSNDAASFISNLLKSKPLPRNYRESRQAADEQSSEEEEIIELPSPLRTPTPTPPTSKHAEGRSMATSKNKQASRSTIAVGHGRLSRKSARQIPARSVNGGGQSPNQTDAIIERLTHA
jgi:hypothetical protein